MRTVELICLAYSYRDQGACIAGLDADTLEWIRPVTDRGDGALLYQLARYADWRRPSVLDVMHLDLEEPRPQMHQPENWLIRQPPRFLRSIRPSEATRIARLARSSPYILGYRGGYIEAAEVSLGLVDQSLVLIRPVQTVFERIKHPRNFKGQIRTYFSLPPCEYDLPVTDYHFADRLQKLLDIGETRKAEEVCRVPEPIFCVSLGANHNGKHYKLVAGVIEL